MLRVNTFHLFVIYYLVFIFQISIIAQVEDDFSFNDEPELEWSGNLDVKYSLFNMDKSSAQYKLQFMKEPPSSSLLSQYRLEPYLNAEYRTSELGFVLKTHASYYSDENARFDLFEAYANYNPSFNVNIQAGKKVYNWGKGYAFNPAGFVNPVKDPENPELAQAGLLSANIEYLKSFQSDVLQSFSFLAILISTSGVSGTAFGEVKNTDIALKSYFLFMDTDIDLLAYYSNNKAKRFGFDFARNIQENIEIHGELSYNHNVVRFTIANNSLYSERVDAYSYLFGLRYLDVSNTTIIFEYYHNGSGINKSEYEEYNGYLNNGANIANPLAAQQTFGVSQTYFKSTTLMKDYLYIKFSHPEPFDWLYFTPSLFSIYNLADKSFLLSFQVSYKPVTNIEFLLWPSFLFGDDNTEFGSRQVQQKIEFWTRVYF